MWRAEKQTKNEKKEITKYFILFSMRLRKRRKDFYVIHYN